MKRSQVSFGVCGRLLQYKMLSCCDKSDKSGSTQNLSMTSMEL